jgi:hypothetical protein
MPSLGLELSTQPEVIANPAAFVYHEGLMCHGNIQLGLLLTSQARVFSETFNIRHMAFPPLFDLAVESGPAPAWCPGLTIAPLPPLVPPPPGTLPAVFMIGIPPVMGPALPMTTATPNANPFQAAAQAALLAALPGGFASWSIPGAPGTVHQLQVSGSIAAGLLPGLYSHPVYISASLSPLGAPRARVAKFTVGVMVQATG